MFDFDEAQKRLSEAGPRPTRTESVPLDQAEGRVLARPVTAQVDLPPADNSAMDGYALRHADAQPGRRLPIQQRCYAGQAPEALNPGHAIRLFTGSLVPDNADTVVMQEDCEEADDTVVVHRAPALGAHMRRRGEDVTAGRELFAAGTRLGAAEIALIASQGLAAIDAWPVLRVGILTTGDELAAPGTPRRPEQIYNSNGPMLATLVRGLGAQATHVLHALDTPESLDRAFATLLAGCDLILTVGGVSVGEKDLVKPAIENAGGTLDLWRVRMKPGKPVALAHAHGKPIVCLPGNPVSAFAVFTLLVSPLVRTMQGRHAVMPRVLYGTLDAGRDFDEPREEFLRVRYEASAHGTGKLVPYPHQGSGVISSLPWADGLARIPANTHVTAGETVTYYDFKDWLA
jgi:molybdopterin molybdotransferase